MHKEDEQDEKDEHNKTDEQNGKPYEVGYKKPPIETRFKKGQSGNPTGRPKGVTNFDAVFAKEMAQKVVVKNGGERQVMTRWQALLRQQTNKAISGNNPAAKLVVDTQMKIDAKASRNDQLEWERRKAQPEIVFTTPEENERRITELVNKTFNPKLPQIEDRQPSDATDDENPAKNEDGNEN